MRKLILLGILAAFTCGVALPVMEAEAAPAFAIAKGKKAKKHNKKKKHRKHRRHRRTV
jgi:hypothetical protein